MQLKIEVNIKIVPHHVNDKFKVVLGLGRSIRELHIGAFDIMGEASAKSRGMAT